MHQKRARKKLASLSESYLNNPPNRKARKDLLKLFKQAGLPEEIVSTQINRWPKNEPTING